MADTPSWLTEENVATGVKVAKSPAAQKLAKNPVVQKAAKEAVVNAATSQSSSWANEGTYSPPANASAGKDVESGKPDSTSDFADMPEEQFKTMQRYHLILRCLYMVAAVFLGFAAGYSLVGATDVGLIFFALYVLVFSLLVCCFEVGLNVAGRFIATNFGFMYSLVGRMVFILFVGFMAYPLKPVGLYAMIFLYCCTLVHIVFMCKFPRFDEYLRKKHYVEGK